MNDFTVCSERDRLQFKLVSEKGVESAMTYDYTTLVNSVADAYEVSDSVKDTALSSLKDGFDVSFHAPDDKYYIICGVVT